MSIAEYLRQQAAACQRLARSTFDLTTAERLRFLAAELHTKAEQVDDNGDEDIQPHMIPGNGLSGSRGENGRG
jgi:hypothetical protein